MAATWMPAAVYPIMTIAWKVLEGLTLLNVGNIKKFSMGKTNWLSSLIERRGKYHLDSRTRGLVLRWANSGPTGFVSGTYPPIPMVLISKGNDKVPNNPNDDKWNQCR